ncbi:MAG: recombinase family protein, partial [Geminicoccaceae bacterium]
VRPIRGPAPHALAWVPADSSRVLSILHNPAYAGAYAYGQRRQDPTRRRPGQARGATVKVAVERWPVCLRDAHPGYIGWEEFVANQARLAGNVARHADGRPGVPRKGGALLQGIVVCGRCGRHMGVRYSGPHGSYPVYRWVKGGRGLGEAALALYEAPKALGARLGTTRRNPPRRHASWIGGGGGAGHPKGRSVAEQPRSGLTGERPQPTRARWARFVWSGVPLGARRL